MPSVVPSSALVSVNAAGSDTSPVAGSPAFVVAGTTPSRAGVSGPAAGSVPGSPATLTLSPLGGGSVLAASWAPLACSSATCFCAMRNAFSLGMPRERNRSAMAFTFASVSSAVGAASPLAIEGSFPTCTFSRLPKPGSSSSCMPTFSRSFSLGSAAAFSAGGTFKAPELEANGTLRTSAISLAGLTLPGASYAPSRRPSSSLVFSMPTIWLEVSRSRSLASAIACGVALAP